MAGDGVLPRDEPVVYAYAAPKVGRNNSEEASTRDGADMGKGVRRGIQEARARVQLFEAGKLTSWAHLCKMELFTGFDTGKGEKASNCQVPGLFFPAYVA